MAKAIFDYNTFKTKLKNVREIAKNSPEDLGGLNVFPIVPTRAEIEVRQPNTEFGVENILKRGEIVREVLWVGRDLRLGDVRYIKYLIA